ncbi:MAG: transposase [Solirubrobacteraceae bacterium]
MCPRRSSADARTSARCWIPRSRDRRHAAPCSRGVRTTDLGPLHVFADTLEAHWEAVLRWHHSRINNGLLEGLSTLIEAAKRRARGYRSTRNFKAMIYLVAGKLNAGPQLA